MQSPLAERDSGRPGGGSADLGRRTLVVATHVYATGPGHALAEYGASRAGRMVFMGHPFGYAPDVRPLLERWQEGVLVTRRHVRWRRGTPELVSWARDVALTLVWGFRTPGTADVFVGCDSLLAATGLMLRRLGKARIVVLWTIDYVPERFGNPVLNRIYHAFDKLCVRRCDETWNLSPVMEEARAARGVHGRQRVVPMGASSTAAVGRRNSRQLVFVGHLLEKQGVQLVLEALPTILRRLPEARLLVIGDGPYRPALERQAERLGVSQAVEFAGFVEDPRPRELGAELRGPTAEAVLVRGDLEDGVGERHGGIGDHDAAAAVGQLTRDVGDLGRDDWKPSGEVVLDLAGIRVGREACLGGVVGRQADPALGQSALDLVVILDEARELDGSRDAEPFGLPLERRAVRTVAEHE